MFRTGLLISLGLLWLVQPAAAQRGSYDALIARHAAANGVPAALVHKVMMRESGGNPRLVGRCGCYGLMQIKPATARSMGYTGSPSGLLDPETNMTYAVRYLAGAYRAAGGNAARADSYYRTGYYYAAKRQRIVAASRRQQVADATVTGSIPAQPAVSRRPARTRAVATAANVPTPVAAPRDFRTAASTETIPMPVAAPRKPESAVRVSAATTETIPTPMAAPRKLRTAAITETVPTPVVAPHRSVRPRAKRAQQTTATNPVARWIAGWSAQASSKARRPK
jgi:hypothetical protein